MPFANFVALVPNIPASQFKEILENAVSRVEFIDGRFAQVAGFRCTWDPNGTAQGVDDSGNVTTAGTRVREVVLDDGRTLVRNGGVVDGAPDVNIASIDFSARGGDQYPFRGAAFFTLGVGYQQALANFIMMTLEGLVTATAYPEGGEGRSVALTPMQVTGRVDDGRPTSPIAETACQFVDLVGAPDIAALQEVQDNSGSIDNGVVAASRTYETLIIAIEQADGPTYDFRDIAPQDNQDGGQPGGNIRVGFLFNPQRVTFVDRGEATAITATAVVEGPSGPELTLSPGRLDPANAAFTDSRKPLAAEFLFERQRLFLINNHFTSKTGSDSLFGRFHPPTNGGVEQREMQAQVVRDFVAELFAIDAAGTAARLFADNYLAVSQNGAAPIRYPTFPFPSSDHRLLWVDVVVPR